MRLFIAIDFSDEFFKGLQTKIKGKARLVKSFHLTLKFLGEVDENKAEQIKGKLDDIKFKNFPIIVNSVGRFGDKVIWTGIKEEGKLKELQKEIENKLNEYSIGFKFHPHITLARGKGSFKGKIKEKEFSVDSFKLIKSTLTREGPVYTVLKEYKAVE